MSRLTPTSSRGSGLGMRPRRGLRLVVLVVVLAAVALAAGAWWHYVLREDDQVATPRVSCPPTVAPPTVIPVRQVRVNVYNATQRRGLAATVASELKRRGFRVGTVANDPLKKKVTGLGEIRSGQPEEGAARTVAAHVGQVVLVPDRRTDASVDLVLGATFKKLVQPAQAAAALTPSPPARPAGC